MKYQVVTYQEVYTTVVVEATDPDAAECLVRSGDYDEEGDVIDVTAKEFQILSSVVQGVGL